MRKRPEEVSAKRAAELKPDEWLAPAAHTPRLNSREQRIVKAHADGADLQSLVRHHHTHPALLFRLLGMNPADQPEVFAALLEEFNGLRTRTLR